MNSATIFRAVVLAGDRGPGDPVAREAGTSCKALVPVAGRPMIFHVLDTLHRAAAIAPAPLVSGSGECLLGQSPELLRRLAAGTVTWRENESSPSRSALAAFTQLQQEYGNAPVLLTTADHPLLTPAMVDHFCNRAADSGLDIAAGVVPATLVAGAFPESRRTVTRLRDGGICGANLFALLTPRAGQALSYWRRVEAQRKSPLKIVRTVGFFTLLSYLFGRLTLAAGCRRLSAAMGVRGGTVEIPFPEAAVDVDTPAHRQQAEEIIARRHSP
ncbi:MAG: nucleotidyltransferase family protein [Deltaproteobacteria bacterium]|nr:nucleotidyltransferase family protein [Candidatus Anaeroferrophillacea bacterium]